MGKADDYRRLSAKLDKEPLTVVSMRELRDIFGATRLSNTVTDGISKDLAGYGVGHLPSPLPLYQDDPVRLFRRGTRLADIVDAVLSPSDSGDDVLVAYANNSDSRIVEGIRRLLAGN